MMQNSYTLIPEQYIESKKSFRWSNSMYMTEAVATTQL